MKKIVFTLLIALGFSITASAQVKPVETVKISTPTVQCKLCKTRIEQALKRYDGVLTVLVNIRKKETTVKFLTDRSNVEIIKAAIANVGYDANEIAANPDSYKLLPRTCKKKEE